MREIFTCFALIMLVGNVFAKDNPDCKGLYIGKTYYTDGSAFSPPNEIRIVGVDKEDDGAVTMEFTQGSSREKGNLEFNSCKKFKDAMIAAKARNSK